MCVIKHHKKQIMPGLAYVSYICEMKSYTLVSSAVFRVRLTCIYS